MILGLVANKIDLEQKVSKEKGEKLAEDIGAFFMETSAKNNNGEFSEFVEKLVNEFLVKCSIKGWEFIDKDYGEVDCSLNGKVVRILRKGDNFGERSILIDSTRSLDVIAKCDCVCYSVSISTLKNMLGDNFRNY